jgi:cation diffusion facilitator CzcD-associated flavoprotein CzcO
MRNAADRGRSPRIVVIGAGPGGICAVIKLKEAGFHDVVVVERTDGVGGTWRQNRYPGCACDVPSHLYSFSFALKRDWSRPYAPQPEILGYLEDLAESNGVLEHCRFGNGVRAARWVDADAVWALELDDGGLIEADVVISAIGMFNDIAVPDIPGLEDFEWTMFHSARWDWDHDLTAERVAVIGSAASAVQFVPEIVAEVQQLHLFQRTANWILPKLDDPYTEEQLRHFREDPDAVAASRQELFASMNSGMTFQDPVVIAEREGIGLQCIAQVEDPEVRARLVPDHPWGCKRPLFSNHWYPAFNRPNLELVTEPIDRITAHAVVTVDGVERPVDTVVVATGFAATRYLSAIDVVGRDGVHVEEAWNDGATAHLGVTTSGFPNLFMLYGPNTNNGSILTMIEYQVAHVVAHLRRLVDEDLAWVDVRPEPMAAYTEEVQRGIAGVEVWQDSCSGYYRTPGGRVVTQWPFSMTDFRDRTAVIDPDDYVSVPRRARV